MRSLTIWGRAASLLFLVHVALLFFPPIPPDIKGSLWSYLLAYLAVLCAAVEVGRRGPRLASAWGDRSAGRRWGFEIVAVVAALLLGLGLREIAPARFIRFSREEGLWEPLTLFCYLASAVLLFGLGRRRGGRPGRHWIFLGGLYTLMALEEIDYFGIFGGLIGRIEGIYVGSLHDLVGVAASGLLDTMVLAILVGAALLVVSLLLATGFLQPGPLMRAVLRRDAIWAVVGVGFLFLGAAVEAELFGWRVAEPRPEEALELAGGLALAIYAVRLVAEEAGRAELREATT